MTERWLPIAGYEGHYEVSDGGRVRSVKRGAFRILRPNVFGIGYLSVLFSKVGTNHNRKRSTVHSLVLEAFVGPRPAGMEACHYPDPTPSNCSLQNLMWGTPATNASHRVEMGSVARGEACSISKLTERQVRTIYRRYANGETARVIAPDFNITTVTVRRIGRGTTWKHLGLTSP